MLEQLRQLQAAFVILTRLPFASAALQEQHFQNAHRYYPLVGLVIGLITAAAYTLANTYMESFSAMVIALIVGVMVTGAFHEDGFADACDGFGGGRDPEHIIHIMKDSRLGTYGVLGLILLFGFKIALISDVLMEKQALLFIVMHGLSRVTPLCIMAHMQYAENEQAKIATGLSYSQQQFYPLLLVITAITLLALPLTLALALVASILGVAVACQHYFQKRLNGYNGDCLGASEQLAECAIILVFAFYY